MLWPGTLRLRDTGKENTGMNLKAIKLESVDWIHLLQNKDWWSALVNTANSLWVPQKSINLYTCSKFYKVNI